MKLWDKGQSTQRSVEEFSVGMDREFDLLLAEHDVVASIAHAIMLQEVGILSEPECASLVAELRRIHSTIIAGEFRIDESCEDVHSQIELMLTQRVGEAGKKIHTGRSRNDQVLVDLKLYMRAQLSELRVSVRSLYEVLMHAAERHAKVLLPGYTHFQIAMPSSFGLWFSAYAESLVDDMEQLVAAYNIINKNPLGSAAGYGSTFALERERTTSLLGFAHMNVSSVYAQMTRGKAERVCAVAMASIASTLSKLAYDVCLYSSQNFAFLKLPSDYTTGSSLMPHKNNPDVFELIRARCNRLQALPNDIAMITTNLPSGYHRDFQILKELVFPAFVELGTCLAMCKEALPQLELSTQILDDPKYAYLYSVDAVHHLVQQGQSFRDAYRTVGEQIQRGEFQAPSSSDSSSHEGSINNLRLDLIEKQMAEVQSKVDWSAADRAIASLVQNSERKS